MLVYACIDLNSTTTSSLKELLIDLINVIILKQ